MFVSMEIIFKILRFPPGKSETPGGNFKPRHLGLVCW